ncbi:MAG: NRDE family protein [Planctomycetes bacterium]|nr:NRDE family protein [Planctomycetota bacterium]
MCLLIVLRGEFADHPIVVAANRDERKDRPSSPPGLWIGRRRRVIAPRDRVAGGTWLGVNDRGLFAGITNLASEPPIPGSASRGSLPHAALDCDGLEQAVAVVRAELVARPWSGCQLVLCDGRTTVVIRHCRGDTTVSEHPATTVLSNEHAPGALVLPGLSAALAAPAADAAARLSHLRPLLLDRGGDGRHPVLKDAGERGTVSSSLLAVPAGEPTRLLWLYAAGAPDRVPFRDYGNLGRRLLPDADLP